MKKLVARQLRNSLEQLKRNDYSDSSCSLKEMFFFHPQPVDTICHDILHGAWDNDVIKFQSRPIIDQEKQAGHGETFSQNVKKGLGLVIDPVQVFENQQQILSSAFPDANS